LRPTITFLTNATDLGTVRSLRVSISGALIYPAPQLDAAKQWWTDLLGIEPYFDRPFYVGFQVGGYELALMPDADPADGALVYWGVPDVAEAVASAVEAGSTEHTPVADVGDGIVTATVRTPGGTILGLTFNPNFSLD
jgi:catechol 2,3-dioxygenase-like lactoylglutathione lyase family enzyme